jgi:excinuclease ABC subunit C
MTEELTIFDHITFLLDAPTTSGVYIMYDHQEVVIYVGKAKNLKARLRQYFAKTPDSRPFVLSLPHILSTIQTISTHNEKEALILERTLILRYSPRYNIAIKFGSGHLYLKLDQQKSWPKFYVTRQRRKDGSRYFGPYLSGSDLRAMTQVIERAFQIRTCDDRDFRNRSRPCMQFQIKRCSGPCVLPVDRDVYLQEVESACQFLLGRHPELLKELKQKMFEASKRLEFERAARFRDQIQSIERSLQPQEVAGFSGDHDVIGLYRSDDHAQLVVMEVRGGVLLRSRPFLLEDQGADNVQLLVTFLHLYYAEGTPVPKELLIPIEVQDFTSLHERLVELRGGAVHIKYPQRGRLVRLLAMAQQNAEQSFFQAQRATKAREETLVHLKKLLKLTQIPRRIECFDISIFQGEAPMASNVVFENALPRKQKYRVQSIKSVEGTDDFAMMREAITRRFQNIQDADELPHLLVVDGGKGQLGVALAVLADLGLNYIDVVGLAKSRFQGEGQDGSLTYSSERIFVPGIKSAIALRPGTGSYRLLTQLRDEAHRVAITAHRRKRSRQRLSSPLDEVVGVGPKRRKALLKSFGSLRGIYEATVEELVLVSGISPTVAQAIYKAFRIESPNDVKL